MLQAHGKFISTCIQIHVTTDGLYVLGSEQKWVVPRGHKMVLPLPLEHAELAKAQTEVEKTFCT